MSEGPPEGAESRASALEVFRVALGLGLTSFGGPIAHLGDFERAYVAARARVVRSHTIVYSCIVGWSHTRDLEHPQS